MSHEYSLAHLSMIGVAPARLASVATDAGFAWTGFRLTPSPSTGVDHRVLGSDAAVEALRRAVEDAGVQILDVEVIRMKPGGEDPGPLLAAAQALGARYVIATIEDPDPVRRVDTLARVAERAAQHGTALAVEFMVFSEAPTLGAAVEAVRESGAPNVVVLADVLHLVRSGGSPADLEACPAALLPYAQVCGASGAGPMTDITAARAEAALSRLLPDQGDLPVREFVAALPPHAILSIEAPLAGQADPTDPVALAKRMLAAARRAAGEDG